MPKPASTTPDFAGLGLQFVMAVVAGMYGGQWLDRRFGSAPWFLVGCVFLAAGLSFYSVYRKLMIAQALDDAERKARRDGKA